MFPCRLFGQVNGRIWRDEARHVAFGRIYLRDKLAALPFDERVAIYRWVKELWHECARANSGCRPTPGSAIMRLGRDRLNARWLMRHRALIEVGLISDDDALPAERPAEAGVSVTR